MSKMLLPGDIRRYIRKKIFFRIFGFVVLEALAISFLVLQRERIIDIAGRADLLIATVVLLVVPFLIAGIPYKLIGNTWRGTVVDVKVKTTIDFPGRFLGAKGVGGGMYHKNTIHLKVEKDNGRIVDVKALELGVQNGVTKMAFDGVIFGRLDDHIDNFKKGDIVYHFYGLKRPLVIHKSQDKFMYCVVCGCRNFTKDDSCSCCGYSLLKNIDNKNAPTYGEYS